jgi:sulfur-oxidizing protein SoxY
MKQWYRMAALVAGLVFGGQALANEKAEPDASKSQYWTPIRHAMFGDRPILDGRDVIRVYINTRADDASTVPVAVKGQIDQTPQRFIKQVYVIVERNPSPAAGVFQFTPDSGRAQVETRLRFEDFSFVRAIAEMNDGQLYESAKWVKAAGGCSAPSDKFKMAESQIGRMKFRFDDDTVEYDKPTLVQLMIRHPNESGLASDFDQSKTPRFVRQVKVTYDGQPVMEADVDFSISDNPSFRFFFTPKKGGELKAFVEDTFDKQYQHAVPITAGAPLPGG